MERFDIPDGSTEMTYAEAIRRAVGYQMQHDNRVLVYGLGVDDSTGMYGTTLGFDKRFGSDRCFDMPLSEDAMTGYGIGLAVSGFRPIYVHQRADFLLLCMNQLVNMAAKVDYLSSGELKCPLVVRAVIGRSWGQGAQHSQSLYSLFGNIPGLEVIVPASANDVYNAYSNAHKTERPTIIIEHRMLYKAYSNVQNEGKMPTSSKVSKETI